MYRGAEDSASNEELKFKVVSTGIKNSKLGFKFEFDSPLSVSVGETQDVVIGTIVNESFFASQNSGMGIKKGTPIEILLPKLLSNDEFGAAGEAIEAASRTIVITQICVTVVMAVSLKQMWNFMNVVQVLAYIRFFAAWPAFMILVF